MDENQTFRIRQVIIDQPRTNNIDIKLLLSVLHKYKAVLSGFFSTEIKHRTDPGTYTANFLKPFGWERIIFMQRVVSKNALLAI